MLILETIRGNLMNGVSCHSTSSTNCNGIMQQIQVISTEQKATNHWLDFDYSGTQVCHQKTTTNNSF
jgi:hypothetical protein